MKLFHKYHLTIFETVSFSVPQTRLGLAAIGVTEGSTTVNSVENLKNGSILVCELLKGPLIRVIYLNIRHIQIIIFDFSSL